MNATMTPARNPSSVGRPGLLRRAGMALRFVAFGGAFDFFSRGTNPGGGRLRRSPSPETKPEESIALPWERNTGVALVRDLLRNAPQARGLSKTIRVNTVGPLGKLVFRDDGEWQTKAAEWFNGTWGRHADYVDGSTWREMLQLCMSAIAFEGDFVAVFDDGALSTDIGGGTGRVALFEADQICDLDKDDFAKWQRATGREDWVQAGGILVDGLGRKRGVVCCREHGKTSAPITMCLVLVVEDPMAPDAENWRHVGRKFRLRQLRGTPEAFAAAPIIADNHEMLELERIAAKQNSARSATVLLEGQGDDGADITISGGAADSGVHGSDGAVDGGAAASSEQFSLPALERTGVGVDVVEGVRDIKYKDASTPNSNLAPFVDYGMDMAGMALGIGHSQSRYKTDSSYTSFRGDLAMTWATFADNQRRIYRVRQLIRDYRIQDVIYHVLRGCLVYDYEYQALEEEMGKLGIPIIRVETDYNEEDVEQLRIRVEAFIELIKYGRNQQ